MIQIGDAFFDESFSFGIAPDRDSRSPGGSVVFLQNGSRVAIDATTEDVAAALRQSGLLADEEEQAANQLDNDEIAELVSIAGLGAYYIAKDARGIVFAFHNPPVRAGAYWNKSDDDRFQAIRLSNKFEGIDFGETYLSIASVLLDNGIEPF